MYSFRNLPIARKLMLISMLTSVAALLLACVAFLTYEQVAFRRETTRNLSITAQMAGFNCAAALTFNDVGSAEQTLKALGAQPHIVGACIYGADGKVFATFSREGHTLANWPSARDGGEKFEDDSLMLFRPIDNAGERIGIIFIQSDLGEMRDRLRQYILIAASVLAASILIAWLIAARLQRFISEPVSQLLGVANRVATERNYGLRAAKRGNDELGRLIDGFNDMLGEIQRRDADLQSARDDLEKRVDERTEALRLEVREREKLHRQLLQTSRQAGMAEVATGVLHNVGNVLNSVNVSATLVADKLRHSKVANLSRICQMMRDHESDLAGFLTGDPKGQIVVPYLTTLAEGLSAERVAATAELEGLQKNIEHIKDIVAMQQNYAKTSGVAETVSIPDLVEDALRMNAGSLARHDVDVARDYQARPVITVEKHKVLQVLVNLVRNAKYACDESGRVDKLLTIRTTADAHGVSIAVIDNGVGIPQENLTRIFAHGFTTRAEGHGFGLHSGALSAKELGGTLTGHSAGLGKGATFILELPYKSEAVTYEESLS
jgi:two-component system NtrC family sensor kinase